MGYWVADNEPSTRYPLYTRGNVGEVFPDPVAPWSWSMGIVPGAEPGWRDALVRFGAFDADEFSDERIEILGIFGGYCYLNVSISRILGVRTPGLTPELIDYSFFGEQAAAPPYTPSPGDESPEHSARVGQTLQWVLSAEELPELEEERQAMRCLRAERPDVSAMTDRELFDRAVDLMDRWFRRLFGQHLYITYCATVGTGIITEVARQLGDPGLAMRLVAALGAIDSAAPSWALWDLGRMAAASPTITAAFEEGGVGGVLDRLSTDEGADARRFLDAFRRFLHEFGSRGPNEWEVRCPTWETDPRLALAAVELMRVSPEEASPQRRHDALADDREQLTRTVTDRLAGQPEVQAQFEAAIRSAAVFLPGRERTKTTVVMLVHEVRVLLRELGRRRVEAGQLDAVEDVGMLTGEELRRFLDDPGPLRDVVRDRVRRWEELAALVPPFVVDGEVPPPDTWERRSEHHAEPAAPGTVLQGIPGCPGRAEGRARVVHDPLEVGGLEPGDVLVAPITDPSWTPLFVPAAAVVVDVGAQLSHAVIVSRELGIPCVVSVTDATTRIPDGARVVVDGTSGTVAVGEVA